MEKQSLGKINGETISFRALRVPAKNNWREMPWFLW